jgi:hypothetical protein
LKVKPYFEVRLRMGEKAVEAPSLKESPFWRNLIIMIGIISVIAMLWRRKRS